MSKSGNTFHPRASLDFRPGWYEDIREFGWKNRSNLDANQNNTSRDGEARRIASIAKAGDAHEVKLHTRRMQPHEEDTWLKVSEESKRRVDKNDECPVKATAQACGRTEKDLRKYMNAGHNVNARKDIRPDPRFAQKALSFLVRSCSLKSGEEEKERSQLLEASPPEEGNSTLPASANNKQGKPRMSARAKKDAKKAAMKAKKK